MKTKSAVRPREIQSTDLNWSARRRARARAGCKMPSFASYDRRNGGAIWSRGAENFMLTSFHCRPPDLSLSPSSLLPTTTHSPPVSNVRCCGGSCTRLQVKTVTARTHAACFLAGRLFLHRRFRSENLIETLAVLKEDQHPQNTGDQRRRDSGWRKRQVSVLGGASR